MNIIAQAGQAKSLCYRAIDALGRGSAREARELLEEAEGLLKEVHEQNYQLLSGLDSNVPPDPKAFLLVIHAEDIFMSTMTEKEILKALMRNHLLHVPVDPTSAGNPEKGGEIKERG